MNKLVVNAFFLFILILTVACSPDSKSVSKQEDLRYDTATIAILKYDSVKSGGLAHSEPINLTQDDMNTIDSILRKAIDDFNKKVRHRPDSYYKFSPAELKNHYLIDLKEYKRQYLPFNDNNFQNKVWVNCFCNFNFRFWKQKIVSGNQGGKCYFSLEISLSEKNYRHFFVNGYG